MNASVYPVRVDAHLDSGLNRWLWLLKWILAIPHFVVLAFLWMAFVVLSIFAGLAILFTGHYPRSIFEFNVGVLRWSWRVAYYAYGALGTDRYPPFTLAEVPDYPAHLEVEYPDHLSRGLVLVKWWLLAIPHYLILAVFLGGGLYVGYAASADSRPWSWSGGLIALLVVIAAVVLLFTGRYPQQIFDLVLGMNRWVLRVAAYAALMTDEYPPFRLDMGGADPGSGHVVAVPAAPSPPTPTTGAAPTAPGARRATPSGWTTGRVLAAVVGSMLLVVAGGLVTGGTVLAVADQTMRDDQGFFMTGEQQFATGTFAIASEPMQLRTDSSAEVLPRALLGEAKLRVTPLGKEAVFVGVADARDAAAYLDGVAHATLVGMGSANGANAPVYRDSPGEAPAVPPGEAGIWVAEASGTGEQTLRWNLEPGDWAVVVMNADGARNVAVDVAAGATVPAVPWVVAVLLSTGLIVLVVALVLVIGAVRSASRKQEGTQT